MNITKDELWQRHLALQLPSEGDKEREAALGSLPNQDPPIDAEEVLRALPEKLERALRIAPSNQRQGIATALLLLKSEIGKLDQS
jgi:hypothetical protein